MLFDVHKDGWIEVVTGPMFAGKTEELIRRMNRLKYAKKKYLVFKPAIDTRYGGQEVISHSGWNHEAINIHQAKEILDYVTNNTEAVVIDEVNFFNKNLEIVGVIEFLAGNGIRVIVGGLDMDFRGEPFDVMKELIARAEFVTKLTAICMICGAPATRSQRLVDEKPAAYDDPIIQVGAAESYEARCRHCHQVKNKPDFFTRKL